MIPSKQWVEAYKLRLARYNHLYKDFLKTKTTELVNKLIVDPIIEEMRSAGVSRKIWENVEVNAVIITNRGIYINIHNEYWSEGGFDVALAREEGTDDHMIRPRRKNALSWIQGGRRRFSAGHMVTGLPRLNIIEHVIERGEADLQIKLNEEFSKWKTSIFS